MSDPDYCLHMVQMRIDRAIMTIEDAWSAPEPIAQQTFRDAVTRLVIVANTVASALLQDEEGPEANSNIANLLWSIGERLNVPVDEGRR